MALGGRCSEVLWCALWYCECGVGACRQATLAREVNPCAAFWQIQAMQLTWKRQRFLTSGASHAQDSGRLCGRFCWST